MNFEELSESDGESSEEVEQNVVDEGSSAAMTQSSVRRVGEKYMVEA